MKKFFAFFLCALIVCLSLMLAGCGCMGCGADTTAPNGSVSSGTPGDMNGTNGSNITNGTNGTASGTGNLTDDIRNGVDDLIDGADSMLNDAENTIDGTPDGADTYGATDDTNLDDAGKAPANNSSK